MKNKAKQDLIWLYGARCMLTNYKNDLTYHHNCEKKCDGGKETVENGALLNEQAHRYLNIIEKEKPQLYYWLCEGLQLYKECRDKNLTQQLETWKEVQEKFVKRMKRGGND